MQDNELSELLSRARRAGQRLDTARAELAFETRMSARVRGTPQSAGAEARFRMWLRGLMGLATATGVAAALFISTRGRAELDDTLAAFWTGNSTALQLSILD